MAGLGSSKRMPVSKAQQSFDGQIGAGAPAQTLSSLKLSLVQGLRSPGDPSHLPHIDQNVECHGEPMQQSCFPRDGEDVRPFERTVYDADREFTAATAQPCTPGHQPRGPSQTGGDKTRKAQRRPRIKSLLVQHNERNNSQIQKLEPHLRSLILFHISNTEALQVFALNRILGYRDQHPPIHICRVERKNDDPRSMILLVICLLCPAGPEALSPFKEPNALPKFAHHFRTVHCNMKNPFVCVVPSCDKTFSLRHDMTRHVKAAHPGFDGVIGDIEGDIPASVVASNVAGPSNTRRAFKGSSPVVARHITSSLPSSMAGPSRMNPYILQPIAPPPSDRDLNTMNAGTGNAHDARPSTGQQAGHMTSLNALWVDQSSYDRSTMSFHYAPGEPYGGLPQIAASGADEIEDYLHTHAQMARPFPPFLSNGNPGGVSGGTHSQIQSRQPDSSTVAAQMALTAEFNHRTNTTAEDCFAQPRQNHMPSVSVQGLRQPMPTRAIARAVSQQRYASNGTSTSARHPQALRHEVDYMAIESARLANLLSEPRSMQPDSQYYTLSTSSQTHHAVSVQQPQPQPQPPPQNRANTTPGHQQTPFSPWEPPQTFFNMGSWASTDPSLDPRSLRTTQNNHTRRKPPQHSGDNVSQDRKTLKGGVERSFRNLLSWLGLIGVMVGVSEALLNAILVPLGPPREGKGCIVLLLSREGEAHNGSQS